MGVDNIVTVDGATQRRSKRARVLLAAKLRTPLGEIDARLRDLSAKGALVECSPVPPVDTEVVFVRGTIQVPARVAWAGTGRVGLEFHYMVDENELLVRLRRAPAAQLVTRFRRPGIKEGSSAEERELARKWGVQVGINLPDRD